MPAELSDLYFDHICGVLHPGLCMSLAFTLGMTIGYRRTLWMMLGELSGVATVFAATFWSLGWILEQSPVWFMTLSLAGGGYLMYLSVVIFRDPSSAIKTIDALSTRPLRLITWIRSRS